MLPFRGTSPQLGNMATTAGSMTMMLNALPTDERRIVWCAFRSLTASTRSLDLKGSSLRTTKTRVSLQNLTNSSDVRILRVPDVLAPPSERPTHDVWSKVILHESNQIGLCDYLSFHSRFLVRRNQAVPHAVFRQPSALATEFDLERR